MPLIIALLLFCQLAFAQSSAEPEYELVDLLGGKAELLDIHNELIDTMVLVDPDLANYRDTFHAWASRYLDWEAVREQKAMIYKQYFTAAELNEILDFYRSNTGRKAVLLTPTLFQEGSKIGETLALEHKQQLIEMLRDARDQRVLP